MKTKTVATVPFDGQRPGTSGLRKPVAEFRQPHYLENFVQSVLDCIGPCKGMALALGGDGRFFNDTAIQVIARLAAANGVAKLVIGRKGILSTPAASHIVRRYELRGALVLSASHNPGGPDGDFGIKFNDANGGPATERITEAIYQRTQAIKQYRTLADDAEVELDEIGEQVLGETAISIIDPVDDYAQLMERLFDFDLLRGLLSNGKFRMCFDAMHAVTGPYATEIFERRLGAPAGTVINAVPSPDFGGGHPDPNQVHAAQLIERLTGDDPMDFGAASDGDGDRNLVHGKNFYLNPCDSLAIIAANLALLPGYPGGATGIARSMPTSRAADRVAQELGIECFETPTGWKFFGSLLDAGRINVCGEESFGTGSSHVREKDGLWAVLCWLNIMAARQQPLAAIVNEHWARYGRDYFMRHDYEGLDTKLAESAFEQLRARLDTLSGMVFGDVGVASADEFSYIDPVDGSISNRQGLRIVTLDNSRIVVRLSGTGTSGATLRLYFDSYRNDPALLGQQPSLVLAPLVEAADALLGLGSTLGRDAPDLVT